MPAWPRLACRAWNVRMPGMPGMECQNASCEECQNAGMPAGIYSLRSTPFPRVNSVYCYFKIAGK